jgi:hypothetical protein
MNIEDNLPSYNNYSSLNSIFMSLLFSENSRDLIIDKTKLWQDDKDKFKSTIKRVVNKNKKKKDITSELLLLKPNDIFLNMKFLKDNDNKKIFFPLFKSITGQDIDNIKFYWIDNFIIDLYRSLGLSCLDIYYIDDSFYKNFYNFLFWKPFNKNQYLPEINLPSINERDIDSTNPDVLILFHKDLNKDVSIYRDAFKNEHPKIKDFLSKKDKKFEKDFFLDVFLVKNEIFDIFKDIKEYYDYNGFTYVLDSVLLRKGNKSIVGFTYEGEKYVYNNFSSNIDCPCSIKKFDWKYNNGKYCYHPYKCDLNDNLEDIGDLCFDFKEGIKTLIYIKQIKKEEVKINEDIDDEKLLNLIEQIKKMEKTTLIEEIKKFDKSIIRNSSFPIEEMQKIYLRHLLTTKQTEEPTIEGEIKTEE